MPGEAEDIDVHWVVPMRGYDNAKSRLETLDPQVRSRLARRSFIATLSALVDQPAHTTFVVTDSTRVAADAESMGATTLQEPPESDGFRSMLRAVTSTRTTTGAIGVLMADLPFVTSGDVALATGLLEHADVVLAPDRRQAGTNLLLMRPHRPDLLRFGAEDSYDQHLSAFSEYSPATLRNFGLGFDIDTPSDVQLLSAKVAKQLGLPD